MQVTALPPQSLSVSNAVLDLLCPMAPTVPSEPGGVTGTTVKATNVASLTVADDREAPHVGPSRSPPAIFDDRDPAAGVKGAS
jgi:hypothetical protein